MSDIRRPLLFLGLALFLGTALPGICPAQNPQEGPITVAYLDYYVGSWILRSTYPLLADTLRPEGIEVGYVLPKLDSEEALWNQLKDFHVLLLAEPIWKDADQAKLVGRVLTRFTDAGGGVFIIGSRFGSQNDAFQAAVPDSGLSFQDRGIQDPGTAVGGSYWWTRQVTPHPTTAGVRCLAYPKIADYDSIAAEVMDCPAPWEVLVRAELTARIFKLEKVHSSAFPAWTDTGQDAAQPPLFAVREYRNGRLAALPAGAEFVIWNLGNPGFPQVFMTLGDDAQNPSDGFRLTVNAIRWLAEPARSSATIGGYKPSAEADAYHYPDAVPPHDPLPQSPTPNRYRGISGLHSNLSDGGATVAEYAAEAKKLGLSFILFADPWEKLTEDTYSELKKQCDTVSDATFRAFPGIQYSDVADIRWVYFRPDFLPRAEYLEAGGKRVSKDGMYAYNASGPSLRLERMPLRAAKMGPDPRNLWWQHYLALWEYDGSGKQTCDNTDVYLKLIANSNSLVPTAYAEVRSLEELKAAADKCVLVAVGPDLASALKVPLPDELPPWPLYSNTYCYVTQGPNIDEFSMAEWNYGGGSVEATRGLQQFRIRVGASSEVGLREVAVLDGPRPYRRFLPNGAKQFSRAWTGLHDRQRFLVVRVTDVDGRVAYSSPRVAFDNPRGLYFCTDNNNALQTQNHPFYHPGRHQFPAYPANWLPSFYGWRGWDGMQNQVSQAQVGAPVMGVSAEGLSEPGDSNRYERPIEVALASYFCNVFKCSTHRVVAPLTDESPALAATGAPLGETPITEQTLTSMLPASRADLGLFWFHPEYVAQMLPDYQATVALFMGTVRFRRAVTLAKSNQAMPVAALSAWNQGLDSFYTGAVGEFDVRDRGEEVRRIHPVTGGLSEKLPPGGFVTAGPILGSPFVANAGDGCLRFDMVPGRTAGDFGACVIGLGEPAEEIPAGTERRFRIVTGFLTDGERAGEVAADLAASLNLGGGSDGYPLSVRKGKLVDANFALTLQAQDGEARFAAGPRKMYVDLPVRAKGLADNGCVAFFEKRIGHFIFVPVLDGDALFQVRIDEGAEVWVGNVFACDQPGIVLTLTRADEPEAQLEVHNPTDRACKARIASPKGAPRFGGYAAEVDVPAGDSVVLTVPARLA